MADNQRTSSGGTVTTTGSGMYPGGENPQVRKLAEKAGK
jgi:hypothetical protein